MAIFVTDILCYPDIELRHSHQKLPHPGMNFKNALEEIWRKTRCLTYLNPLAGRMRTFLRERNHCPRLRCVVKEFQRTLSTLKATQPTGLLISRIWVSLVPDHLFSLLFLMWTNLLQLILFWSLFSLFWPCIKGELKRGQNLFYENILKINKISTSR